MTLLRDKPTVLAVRWSDTRWTLAVVRAGIQPVCSRNTRDRARLSRKAQSAHCRRATRPPARSRKIS